MSDRVFFVVTLVSALGCGLVGGVFFTFSNSVMASLARLPAPQGIAAMNAINIVIVNAAFMIALFGTGLLCAVLVVGTWLTPQRPGAALLVIGSLLYIVGSIVVTIVFNVPRNDALAAVNPASPEGAGLWADYLVSWVAWNHVRTATALAAAALLTLALTRQA